MSSPAIYGGSRTKILTSKGLLLKDGTPIDYNGQKNYITKGTFATNATTGWNLKRTTLSNKIPNQVAASWTTPSVLTLSATSTGALTQAGFSLSLSASGVTTAGDMLVSDSYTIDIEDQAKTLAFKFSYKANTNPSNLNFSGTSSNTFHVYIYDDANSAWIQPTGCYSTVQSSGVGIATGTFQTPANMTSFRIALVSCNASAGAFTLYTDNFFVGPQYVSSAILRNPVGTIITSASLTPPQGYLYCDGSAISRSQYADLFAAIGTTYGSGDGSTTFNLPDLRGRVAVGKDNMGGTAANRMTTAGSGINGTTLGASGGAQNHTLSVAEMPSHNHGGGSHVHGPGTLGAYLMRGTTLNTNGAWPSGGSNNQTPAPFQTNTGDPTTTVIASQGGGSAHNNTQPSIILHYFICYDSGNVIMSSDAAVNVVAAFYNGQPTGTLSGSDNLITFPTKILDTNSTMSGGNYTIPVSGQYRVSAQVGLNTGYSTAGQYFWLKIKQGAIVRGSAINRAEANSIVERTVNIASIILDAKAGDVIGIYSQTDMTAVVYSNDASRSFFSIERISGPAQIAASETVAARYYSTAGNNVTNLALNYIDFATKDYDTHGMILGAGSGNVTTTNTGWKAIVPVSGKYLINSTILSTSGGGWAAGEEWTVAVYIEGVNTVQSVNYSQATHTTLMKSSITTTLNLLAGQRIEIIGYQSSGATLAMNNSQTNNFVEITRVGNY